MGFLDNILGGGGDKNDNESKKNKKPAGGGGISNPFAKKPSFHGQGKSLGGSKPGIVIPISLENPGPLGVRVEKRPNSEGTAIVNQVVEGSQAEAAGMQRGDIVCFAGSNGQEEMMYDMFLELAKSPQRPLQLEVRRITTTATQAKPSAAPNTNSSASAAAAAANQKSAEADHRRQAVIAAAEAREKAHKAKSKPIKTVTKTTLAREKQLQLQQQKLLEGNSIDEGPRSEAARRAAEAAKQGEAQLAQQLGYNPYEAARATAGQARTATTTAQHGSVSTSGEHPAPGSGGNDLPAVAPPRQAMVPAADEGGQPQQPSSSPPPPPEFDEAYATLVSATPDASVVQSTVSIIQKLVGNATTKGQTPHPDAAKFRKVRLGNPKIQAALVDVPGALDIMLLAGFQLDEQEGESVLIFPADTQGPDWWPAALEQLDSSSSSAATSSV